MRPTRTLAWSLALVLVTTSVVAAGRQAVSVPFQELDRGEISFYRYGDPGFTGAQMHFTDPRSWERFWRRHTSEMSPPPPLPEVRFPREHVIVVLLGHQTSGGGPSVQIERIDAFDRQVRIQVLEDRTPGPTDVLTSPYQIVRTPRLPGSLVFEHTEPGEAICQAHEDCPEGFVCNRVDPTCSSSVAGTCQDVSGGAFCPTVYMPVCGCDGATYSNDCFRVLEGVVLRQEGECP